MIDWTDAPDWAVAVIDHPEHGLLFVPSTSGDAEAQTVDRAYDTSVRADGCAVVSRRTTAPGILQAAVGHMQDRAATYDAPQGERSMGKTVAMFNSLYGVELTEEQGWAFMCLLKLVRTSQGAHRADNYEDLAAYAALMGESAQERK